VSARDAAPRADARRALELGEELGTLRIGGPPVAVLLVDALRAVLGTELTISYSAAPSERGLDLEWVEFAGCSDEWQRRARKAFGAFVRGQPTTGWSFNVTRPERRQRNRVIDMAQIERSLRLPRREMPLYRDVLEPLGYGVHDQLRVLVCDGPSLLAWVGAYQRESFARAQVAALRMLVAPLRRRLTIERRLNGGPTTEAALAAALEAIGAPAYVVTATGRIRHANAAGETLLDQERRALTSSVIDAVHRRPAELALDLTPLRGAAAGFVAVLRGAGREVRLVDRVRVASAKWELTRRQQEVLHLVAAGAANRTISDTLRIAERTVEFHVAGIFDKAGVATRAGLMSRLLAS